MDQLIVEMHNTVIIVAGGSGKRMDSTLPKQFMELDNKPVLMHTITRFYSFDNNIHIVLVLPHKQVSLWKSLCKMHNFELQHDIVEGGETRFHSVKNGLCTIMGSTVVGIHDGVRPCVSVETIKNCYQAAHSYGNAIPVLPVNESVRMKENDTNRSFDRSKLWLVQTPQVFRFEIIRGSFEQEYRESFTDDANVVESAGHEINMVDGNRENIKITTRSDLLVAEAFIKNLKY